MDIVVLNGNAAETNAGFDDYLAVLADRMRLRGNTVTIFPLREMDIRSCIGCFSCWVKTPGVCIFADDHPAILRAYVAGDLVLFAAPLVMGFTSALLKKATDRIIPILLPYIDGASGECRHFLRYARSPEMAVLYQPEEDTDFADLEIMQNMWRRLARNAQSRIAFSRSINDPVEEVCREIDRR